MDKTQNTEIDKRQSIRLVKFIPTRVNDGAQEYAGLGKNISRGGMLIETNLPEEDRLFDLLSGNNRLFLKLNLPKERQPIELVGEAVWAIKKERTLIKKLQIGIKFLELSDDKEKIITSYISKHIEEKRPKWLDSIEDIFYKKFLKNILSLSKLGKESVTGKADSGLNFDHMYQNSPAGYTFIGKFLDRILLNLPSVKATRNRKANIVKILKNELENNRLLNRKTKILDLASGPARYLVELITRENQEHIEALCVDLDEKSLEFGKRLAGNRPIHYAQSDILKMKHLSKLAGETSWKPNIIIISGFFVYTDDYIVKRILKQSFEFLDQDGLLIFSSQLNNPSRKLMEYCKTSTGKPWVLFYRWPRQIRQWMIEAGFKGVIISVDKWGMYKLCSGRKFNEDKQTARP